MVALESTLIAHGLPRPRNRDTAFLLENTLSDAGVTPATVAVIDGVPTVGLSPSEVDRIASGDDVRKASMRDLPVAIARRITAATTVASTAFLANAAGIRVIATGGVGGVHRGARDTYDESADLAALAKLPITVVSAGVKSILDIGATLERLESYNVVLVGYGTDRFPGFYLRDSGYGLDWRVDSPAGIVDVMAAADQVDHVGAIVVANPVSAERQLDPQLHDRVLAEGLSAAEGISGKAVTPFLLDYFHRATGGASLELNIELVRNNVALGGRIATEWAARGR